MKAITVVREAHRQWKEALLGTLQRMACDRKPDKVAYMASLLNAQVALKAHLTACGGSWQSKPSRSQRPDCEECTRSCANRFKMWLSITNHSPCLRSPVSQNPSTAHLQSRKRCDAALGLCRQWRISSIDLCFLTGRGARMGTTARL